MKTTTSDSCLDQKGLVSLHTSLRLTLCYGHRVSSLITQGLIEKGRPTVLVSVASVLVAPETVPVRRQGELVETVH